METKAITPSFTERGTIVCPAATVNSKLRAIENLFESCDNKLAGAEMSGCGYTSQSGEIDSMTENMRNLSLYAITAHERVSDHLDRPLYEHFKKNATETITAINLSEITTDNTFGLAEYVEIKRQGQYFVNKSVKNNLTMKDFLGLQEITAEDGTPILENAETMWEFASLFRLEYDTMTEKMVDLDSYLNWYLDTGDAEHKGYHPVADMISGVLDITIVKPVLECILGKDLITGEYLTEYDIRWKSAGIIIDLVTLGGGSKLIKGGMSLKEILEASGKTLTVDALAATATYGTAYIGEEIGLSEEAILVLSTLAGIGTSYTAGKAIFKDAKVVVEGGTGTSWVDLMSPEDAAKYNRWVELREAGLDQQVVNDILLTNKGYRPDPTTYLSKEYIDAHLEMFSDGVTKISKVTPSGQAGPPGGTFVMPKSVADEIIQEANGDVSKLEDLLSLEPGTLGDSPVRLDIEEPNGLRMSSGNELGANEQWIPGGATGGGIPEATIDSPLPGEYISTPIFE